MVNFDKQSGDFILAGRSLPEDTPAFYQPLMDWLGEYFKEPNQETLLTLELEYMNSASSRYVGKLLDIFEEQQNAGNKVKVTWKYNEMDDDALEAGEEFQDIYPVPFEFIPLQKV